VQVQRRRGTGKQRAGLTTFPRVLIVGEDRPAAEEALGVLSQQGYESLLATSARKALRCLAVRSYDCILVDLDREELARPVIQALQRYRADTVGFIITGAGPAVSAIGALREGALDYVRKPYNADILKASAARAIERSSLSRTIRQLAEDYDSANARLRAFAVELQQWVDRMTAELRRNVDQLDDDNRQLADERRRREEFIAMVAHDLAGPFTTISGYVQVLTRVNVASDVQHRRAPHRQHDCQQQSLGTFSAQHAAELPLEATAFGVPKQCLDVRACTVHTGPPSRSPDRDC
jgi:DNA-binding response OmpR family regulator